MREAAQSPGGSHTLGSGPTRGWSVVELLACQGVPLDRADVVISSRPGIWVRFLASLPGAWMVRSSIGCTRPDGAELSSGLTKGMQSCSVKYVSSSFCVHPTDGGAREQRWHERDVAVWSQHGSRPPQTPCYRGERRLGLCCSKAGGPASGSGQGNLQGEGHQNPGKILGPAEEYKELKGGSG